VIIRVPGIGPVCNDQLYSCLRVLRATLCFRGYPKEFLIKKMCSKFSVFMGAWKKYLTCSGFPAKSIGIKKHYSPNFYLGLKLNKKIFKVCWAVLHCKNFVPRKWWFKQVTTIFVNWYMSSVIFEDGLVSFSKYHWKGVIHEGINA